MNQETNLFLQWERGCEKMYYSVRLSGVYLNYILINYITIVQCGMFHQVRVDARKEFYLSLFIQNEYEQLRDIYEQLSHIAPYRQTQSKQVRMYPHVYTNEDAYTV